MVELMKEAIEKEVRKRTPPHIAGQVKESGDVMNKLSAEDRGLTE
jgi:hypothetical protein